MPIFDGVLKDNDFLSIKSAYIREGYPFVTVNREDLYRLNVQIESDTKFLQQKGLMDYSLYLVIEKRDPKI